MLCELSVCGHEVRNSPLDVHTAAYSQFFGIWVLNKVRNLGLDALLELRERLFWEEFAIV